MYNLLVSKSMMEKKEMNQANHRHISEKGDTSRRAVAGPSRGVPGEGIAVIGEEGPTHGPWRPSVGSRCGWKTLILMILTLCGSKLMCVFVSSFLTKIFKK